MKATGIVRHIDDLGRVVIPKEIRRTMRIREGTPLEIYTESDGRVIFKKYSPVGELGEFSREYAEVLFKTSGNPVIVCDRDNVIAAAGISKKEVLEKRVSPELEKLMEDRRSYSRELSSEKIYPVEGVERSAISVSPVLASGDVCGAVLMMDGERGERDVRSNSKLTQAAAMFLGRQMEE